MNIVRRLNYLCIPLVLALLGVVFAHATIVLGTLESDPVTPAAGEPFDVLMTLHDPTNFPVEDAFVLAEFRHDASGELAETQFEDTGDGTYRASLTLPEAGTYNVLLRDQTFRQEEARAELQVILGDTALFTDDRDDFLFPPTATGQSSLQTWLIWLIALPVAVGVLVTIIVLRSPTRAQDEVD